MKSEYDTKTGQFLIKHGIKCRITLSDSKPAHWTPAGHHYRVTLSRPADAPERYQMPVDGFPQPMRPNRLTFDYFGNVADAKKLKTAQSDLVNMQLQMQNTEPHLRVNWREDLEARQAAVDDCHPSAYDVLACVSGNVNTPETFKDFCDELGYEQDSIKALQTFRRCASFSRRLKAFFTASEIEALSEIN